MDTYLRKYRESCIWIDTNLRIERELYLDWYLLKNTARVVSGLIHTYEYRESCIWVDTHLKNYWSMAFITWLVRLTALQRNIIMYNFIQITIKFVEFKSTEL